MQPSAIANSQHRFSIKDRSQCHLSMQRYAKIRAFSREHTYHAPTPHIPILVMVTSYKTAQIKHIDRPIEGGPREPQRFIVSSNTRNRYEFVVVRVANKRIVHRQARTSRQLRCAPSGTRPVHVPMCPTPQLPMSLESEQILQLQSPTAVG